MSRIAIISDIHANLEALQAVLADIEAERCTSIVCLGDVVGYNANPAECLEIVRGLACPIVKGNHDEEVVSPTTLQMNPVAKAAMDWTRSQLTEEQKDWLRRLQLMRLVQPFTIVHSTLDQPKLWHYIVNAGDATSNFSRQFTDICFHGHTHVPKVFYLDGNRAVLDEEIQAQLNTGNAEFHPVPGRKYFINSGSVGQPRDGDWRACYAIFDTDEGTVSFRRVEYDLQLAQKKIIEAGLPEYLAERLGRGA